MKADTVDRGLVGESTARDGDGRPDPHTLRNELAAMEATAAAHKQHKSHAQTRLGAINREIAGRRLPTGKYQQLCREQTGLMKEIARLEGLISEDKARIKSLNEDLRPPDNSGGHGTHGMLRQILREVGELKAQVRELTRKIENKQV